MKATYMTSEVAKIIGIHPNTVRLYEALNLITTPERKENGYRIFTDLHIEELKNARLAFQVEVLQNGLRKLAVNIVKTTAQCDFVKAIQLTRQYLEQVEQEKKNAEEAIATVKEILTGQVEEKQKLQLTRKEVAVYLGVTIDTLRNWELNGLLSVKRKVNGYRIYTEEDIKRLKIIRSLRCANYSLEAILRMLNALLIDPNTDIKEAINTPQTDDDIINACDQLLSSLSHAKQNATLMYKRLCKMEKEYNTTV